MIGKYTNQMQAAILLDGDIASSPLPDLAKQFQTVFNRLGIGLTCPAISPAYVQMFGPNDLQIAVEFMTGPADHGVFAPTLGSPISNMLVPDAAERIRRHKAHILVYVQHGVFGGVMQEKGIADLFNQIGMHQPGHSLAEFLERIRALSIACETICASTPARLVHWTQSNMVFPAESFTTFVEEPIGPLTVHPRIYSEAPPRGTTEQCIGIHTLGAADYIGREIHMEAAPVPWTELYAGALSFIKIATHKNGYIIPDNDTFGIEDDSVSFRVRHVEANAEQGLPDHYQLTLRYSREHGYTTQDAKRRLAVPGGVNGVERLIGTATPEARAELRKMRESEALAEGIGGRLVVTRPADEPPQPSGRSGTARIIPFGKRTGR
ncbi:hypothetical protein M0412_02670 [Agrobacterium sp. O3.4]|uniref:Uncharacterized protein n=2 Tax=Rhizobium/Agrobacterium group TaxID=227290 RepID=A0ABY8RIQ4_9HYPH|nr:MULTISPECIES: hypothetical protein [Rhizobium/Agrobacterium group]MCZ7471959.1 hypothetical protein [Rhizobium rhizogenes]WHO07179.1 hypothetical protein KZ699_08670 [Agrobacterium cucumeris]